LRCRGRKLLVPIQPISWQKGSCLILLKPDGRENRLTATEIQRLTLSSAQSRVIQQRVASLLDDAALAERNTLLGTINEQGAAIIARFEELVSPTWLTSS
jgi:hypothetical protein